VRTEGEPLHPHRHRHGSESHGRRLSDCAEGTVWTVTENRDRKIVEMGLCRGSGVHVVRNRKGEPNLVVGLGSSRFALSRIAASQIMVVPSSSQLGVLSVRGTG
jgi:Fe2+ transport system protein FeoA